MIFIYCRVSGEDQAADGKTSLADQERIGRGLAMMHGEMKPIVYVDAGVSGSIPLAERPEGSKMLVDLRPGDFIVAAKLDRLFRSSLDALGTVDSLSKQGIKVVLADISSEPVSDNGVGKLFFSILAAVATFERERIAERVTQGRQGKKARGGHIGGEAPYGFRVVGEGAQAMLVADEDEQETIQTMRDLWSQSANYHAVARSLAQMGLKGRDGVQFCAVKVRRIVLRDVSAAGAGDHQSLAGQRLRQLPQ